MKEFCSYVIWIKKIKHSKHDLIKMISWLLFKFILILFFTFQRANLLFQNRLIIHNRKFYINVKVKNIMRFSCYFNTSLTLKRILSDIIFKIMIQYWFSFLKFKSWFKLIITSLSFHFILIILFTFQRENLLFQNWLIFQTD